MSLRENVIIDTPAGRHVGILEMIGGLPMLFVSREGDSSPHTPQTFPACWRMSSTGCGDLYTAWRDIEAVMDRLRAAQREAEIETQRDPDCMDLAKADMEARDTR